MRLVPYHLYVCLCRGGTLYTGIAKDVAARIRQHNEGKGAKYTRSRLPVVLLASWEYPDRNSASKAEYAFKQLRREEKLSYLGLKSLPV